MARRRCRADEQQLPGFGGLGGSLKFQLLGIRGGDLTGRGGRIKLQDHGQDVWFRRVRWREIPASETVTPDPDFEPMPVTGVARRKSRRG